MFYTIYKITNQINGKFYIGSHKTKDLNDSYMGSGKYLKYAQEKYGIENFTKEIMYVYDNPEDMYAKEAEIVNEDFLSEENTYNIKAGGFGGFDYINSTGKNLYGKNGQIGYGGQNLSIGWSREKTLEEIQKMASTLREGYKTGRLTPTFLGKHHTEETKAKLRGHDRQIGSKNSQYGTIWVNNGTVNAKQSASEPIRAGWYAGKVKRTKLVKDRCLDVEKRQQYTEWYKLYSQVGFAEFVLITGYPYSQANLVSSFKRHVAEFKPQNGKQRRKNIYA
jgi:hypothetical protein